MFGKRTQILHRSVVSSALDPKIQNKRVQFDKPVIEVEEADPTLRPKPKKKVVKFVDKVDKRKQEPIDKRTRAHNPPVT